MFWKRKADSPESDATTTDASSDGPLAPIRIFTEITTIDGWIDIGRQRLSDILNVEDLLSIATVPVAPIRGQWEAVDRDQMLLVVPPPHVADRALRRHRVKRPIEVQISHYHVRGMVHLLAGIELDSYLGRTGQYFLPLTESLVTSPERPGLEESHPALLVNVRSTAQPLLLQVLE